MTLHCKSKHKVLIHQIYNSKSAIRFNASAPQRINVLYFLYFLYLLTAHRPFIFQRHGSIVHIFQNKDSAKIIFLALSLF